MEEDGDPRGEGRSSRKP